MLNRLTAGVTEVCLHPAIDRPELRASNAEWEGRVDDHEYLCDDPSLPDLIEAVGATRIGYRMLRDLQRSRCPE